MAGMITLSTKCAKCGKSKGAHQAITLACPIGTQSRIGHIHYSRDAKFQPKLPKLPKPQTP